MSASKIRATIKGEIKELVVMGYTGPSLVCKAESVDGKGCRTVEIVTVGMDEAVDRGEFIECLRRLSPDAAATAEDVYGPFE